MPDVVTLTTISSDWGNDLRDRSVQRYSSVANRTTEHPTPAEGDLSYLEDTNDVDVFNGSAWVHVGPPAGAIEMYGAGSAPAGWLLCDGTAVSRSTFATLFGILGTTYGVGDGSTTFNLPDMRTRFPVGLGSSPVNALGNAGGNINHTHTGPSHTHTNPTTATAGGHDHGGSTGVDGGVGLGSVAPPGEGLVSQRTHNHQITSQAAHGHTQGVTGASGTAVTGSGNPPYLVVNFIVKI